jgi:hypothetical protein
MSNFAVTNNAMVLTIKKDATKKDIAIIRKKMEKQHKPKGVDTKKYCEIISLKEDPLDIQKKLRDEWE